MNKYNHFNYHKAIPYLMSKHGPGSFNRRCGRKYKRCFNLLDLKFCSDKKYMTHHTDNSYYYFSDQYKGRKYMFIHGCGILELRTDKYVKSFEDDPILGWYNRGIK